MKQWGREDLQAHSPPLGPNWVVVAAAETAVLEKHGMTVVHSRMPKWCRVDAAAAAGMAVGCTGHLMVEVLKKDVWHMAVKEGQSSVEHCKVLHDAEGGGAVAAAVDGCSGSS